MAAAIIPLIGSAVAALGPMIPGIVQAVEGLFGSKTGPQKLATATTMVTAGATAAVAAGKITAVPDPSTIETMIETALATLKQPGAVPAGPTATPAATPKPTATPATPSAAPGGVKVTFTGLVNFQ
jgi:hypothetical protein